MGRAIYGIYGKFEDTNSLATLKTKCFYNPSSCAGSNDGLSTYCQHILHNSKRPKPLTNAQKYVEFVHDLPLELKRLIIVFTLMQRNDYDYANNNTSRTSFFQSAISFTTLTTVIDVLLTPLHVHRSLVILK
ncbi:unnamed protein product [Ambrosiozyma monospora]|uniref:Unnamed protein product n=1 Tax=Ambrosiozyma monospora TaxID=43982 RepID=A0ACB5TAM4_AMBMO|nr:unnamed protein product [Ambrosiozyma monospora]